MPDIDANNPDHLAFIAYAFDDFEKKGRKDIEDAPLSSASRFLDSLAHTAICKPFSQVVAIGADLQENGVKITVAENSDVAPQVTKHLEDIMDALFDIRAAFRDDHSIKRTPSTSPTPRALKSLGLIAADDTRAVPSRIRQLELSVLRHSFPKIAARIHKGIRYQTFIELATRFFAHCDGVADPSDKNAYVGPLADSENIQDMIVWVGIMYKTSERPFHPTEKELEGFRVSSTVLNTLLDTSSGDVKALHDFCRIQDGFDSTRWLSKISSIRMHFTRVASIIDSSRLSPFLNCRATVSSVENSSQPLSFTITRASFTSILEAATWSPESDIATDATIDQVYILLAKGLRKLAKNSQETQITVRVRSLSVEPSAADEFDIVTSYGAHCECVVLEHLRKVSNISTTFIGVSKLSCRLCHLYFETDAGVYQTRGSQGELARWQCPISSSPETRRSMAEQLLPIIKEKMTVKARRGRSSSQSTVGSNDDYSCDNLSDFADAKWELYNEFEVNTLPSRVRSRGGRS